MLQGMAELTGPYIPDLGRAVLAGADGLRAIRAKLGRTKGTFVTFEVLA
jgi:hypothetical protein